MNSPALHLRSSALLGLGFYTAAEAARLLRTERRSVQRWLGGYRYRRGGEVRDVPALWTAQLPADETRVELGFRDLIELLFVKAFIDAGLGLKTIRTCLDYARSCVADERPFSTRRFATDGRTIFLDGLDRSGDAAALDLKSRQFVFRQIVERTFKDLDIDDEAVVRWRPLDGKPSIVIDPARAFGQPIAAESGVPTIALAQALDAEGTVERVARLYDVPPSAVRDAVRFEQTLA